MFEKQSQKSGYRKWVYGAIGATAAILGGLTLFGDVQQESPINIESGEKYINFLSSHRDYMIDQHNTIVDLKIEGKERQLATIDSQVRLEAILELAKSNKIDFKGQTSGQLTNGNKQLDDNVKFGDKTTEGTVKPADIVKGFGDSAEFNAEIKKMFPKAYERITQLRQDLKVHHLDLGNQIKEVELLAQTTKDNLNRSVRKLDLRKKYLDSGKITPTFDIKIWKYEIKNQISDLEAQLIKVGEIITILDKLQKDCARTADDLSNELEAVKVQLKKLIEANKVSIKDLEKQAAAAKCDFWSMIFTFGAACKAAAKLRGELNQKLAAVRQQTEAAEKLNKRWNYFDSLKKLAGTLTEEAANLLDVAKELENKMQSTYKELLQDFTDDEIDDQLGDEDFANDYAGQLMDAITRLDKQCDKTIAYCKDAKQRLLDALVWDKIGDPGTDKPIPATPPAALIQLDDETSVEAELMKHFYEDLNEGCNQFYEGASTKFAQDTKEVYPVIEKLSKHKHVIMNYARSEFHLVKGNIFNIVDSLIDSQRAIQSVEEYNDGRMKYFGNRIDDAPWKFQLKYSTMVTKYCVNSHDHIENFAEKIESENKAIAMSMDKVYDEFRGGAQKDLAAWDCNEMYPKPKKISFTPKWLGGVTKAADQAFQVYNLVKKFIPGGSKAGKGNVPGGPDEGMNLVELADFDWGQATEKAFGAGQKLLGEMKKMSKDEDENYRQRLEIWQNALDMCNADKQSFKDEIGNAAQTIQLMATPTEFTAEFPEFTITDQLNQYNKDVYAANLNKGDSTAEEREVNKENYEKMQTEFTQLLEDVKENFKAAQDLKNTLVG